MKQKPMDRFPTKTIDELEQMQISDKNWNSDVLETICFRLQEDEMWVSGDLFDVGTCIRELYGFEF